MVRAVIGNNNNGEGANSQNGCETRHRRPRDSSWVQAIPSWIHGVLKTPTAVLTSAALWTQPASYPTSLSENTRFEGCFEGLCLTLTRRKSLLFVRPHFNKWATFMGILGTQRVSWKGVGQALVAAEDGWEEAEDFFDPLLKCEFPSKPTYNTHDNIYIVSYIRIHYMTPSHLFPFKAFLKGTL